MRLALLGLALTATTLSVSAQSDLRVSQSKVTFSAIFNRTGTLGLPTNRSDGDVNVSTPLDAVRYGNAQLIDSFAKAGVIPEKKGWALVAVWADWPDQGNSYKFFLRKKGQPPVEVPANRLNLELTDPFVGQKVTLRDGEVVSGTERYKSLATLTLGPIDDSVTSTRDTVAGTADGILFGTGRYILLSGATTAYFHPGTLLFNGYGEIENDGTDDVLSVSLRFGSSSAVLASTFTGDTPTNPSSGPGATPIVEITSAGGSLMVSGSAGLGLAWNSAASSFEPGATLNLAAPGSSGTTTNLSLGL